MNKRTLYLSIGSNISPRREHILDAVRLLDGRIGPHLKVSSFIQTPSWGFEGPDFLNIAVSYSTDLPAEGILRICKDVERALGRTDEGIRLDTEGKRIYHNRPIDIDIILLGDEKVDTDTLKIPHPLMWERDFVIKPLKEIFDGELTGEND